MDDDDIVLCCPVECGLYELGVRGEVFAETEVDDLGSLLYGIVDS